MGTNSTVGLLQLAEGMSKDVLMAAKVQEVLGLQNNKGLFTRLSPFQILLDDVYGILCPRSEDYASRRDLIRIFNDIAREIYGNNDKCPVVENFGSFLMDMFDGKSDLDLSINFSDQLLETDRIAKRKTLRKFAKKFYSLRSKGHVTTVELILSARVPVLKVTDSGSGIECDLSVGNRDGITKSRIVLMISAIDERFRQLSLMMKVWAKAHDINSSKDGTLNSLSLILLAAFHLQTLDIPILPPFSAIFKDGLDPEAVKKNIPSFLKYGERNKESLAELFVSLLVKLQSVETLWSKGLSASTYEGSWVHRNSKANGYISIEDFTDRSQNTARAVRSKKMNKIYSCIRRSVELIQSFTDGIIDATQLKNRLFGLGPSFRTKIANLNCSNLSQRKKKCPSQGGPVEGQKPGKQRNNGPIPDSMDAPVPSWTKVKKKKSKTGKLTDPSTSNTPTSQGLESLPETLSPNPNQKKKKRPTQGGSVEGQRPGKQGKHGHSPHIVEAPVPSNTKGVKNKKSKTGKKTDPASSGTQTSLQGSDKLQETQGGPAEGQRRGKQGKHGHKKSRSEAKTYPVMTSATPTSFQGLGKSQETLNGSCQPLSGLPVHGSGGYRSQGADFEALNNATPTFQVGQPYSSNQPNQGSGVFGPQRNHVRNFSHVASSIPAIERPLFNPPHIEALNNATPTFPVGQSYGNQPIQGSGVCGPQSTYIRNAPFVEYGGYGPPKTYVDTSGHAASRFPEGHPAFISNPQDSGGFRPQITHVDILRHAAPSHLPREPLPSSSYGGFRSERTHVETLKNVPSFPSNQPFSHSNHQHSQDYGGFTSERYHIQTPNQPFSHFNHQHSQHYGGFRSDRYHVETTMHAPNFRAAQGSAGSLSRMHVDTPNYSASNGQSPYLANHAAGFGPERTHTEIINHNTTHFQPPSYTLTPRPSSYMHHHQPCLPSASHIEPTGLQRSHDTRQFAPLVPSQYAVNMHPYQS